MMQIWLLDLLERLVDRAEDGPVLLELPQTLSARPLTLNQKSESIQILTVHGLVHTHTNIDCCRLICSPIYIVTFG